MGPSQNSVEAAALRVGDRSVEVAAVGAGYIAGVGAGGIVVAVDLGHQIAAARYVDLGQDGFEWSFTVWGEMPRVRAISRVERPWRTSSVT
jgi:hypothetical protein